MGSLAPFYPLVGLQNRACFDLSDSFLERFSKRLTFRIPRIAASCSGSGGSPEVFLGPTAGIIHFEKRCSVAGFREDPMPETELLEDTLAAIE